jgi:ABC-type uncharacterized transport system substrate-binding protein
MRGAGDEGAGGKVTRFDRRDVLKLLSSAPMLCSLEAHAQSSAMPLIGFLDPRSSSDTFSDQIAGFHRGLKETGFIENQNVKIECAWAHDQFDRLPALAAELVRRPVAVIVASGGSRVAAIAEAATTATPIVFAVAQDPVKLGLVASLNRPGRNATGINYFNVELYAKRLELLHKLLPQAARVAVLVNPTDAATMEATIREVKSAASSMGLEIKVFNASSSQEIDAAFVDLARERIDAFYVGGDTFFAQPPRPDHHAGSAQSGPGRLSTAGMGRSRRAHKLWNELPQRLSSDRHLHGAHSQGREAGRLACRPALQIRIRHQSQDREGARADDPSDASR